MALCRGVLQDDFFFFRKKELVSFVFFHRPRVGTQQQRAEDAAESSATPSISDGHPRRRERRGPREREREKEKNVLGRAKNGLSLPPPLLLPFPIERS